MVADGPPQSRKAPSSGSPSAPAKGRLPHGDSGWPAPGTPPRWRALRHISPRPAPARTVLHRTARPAPRPRWWPEGPRAGWHWSQPAGRAPGTAASMAGWSGHRTPTVSRADGGPPRSTVKPGARGTTRVSAPGQYREARCRAARSRSRPAASTCSSVGHQDREGEPPSVGPSVRTAGRRRRHRGVDGQPVDGVGGHGHHLPSAQGLDGRSHSPRAGPSEATLTTGPPGPEPPGQSRSVDTEPKRLGGPQPAPVRPVTGRSRRQGPGCQPPRAPR